ncbi:hypothetical protein ACHQM5_017360 [Ranunculus cassubicifolius]
MWSLFALCFVAPVVVWITYWVYRWRNPICNGRLPPGSMGLPVLGETLQFFKPQSSLDIHPFIKDRMKTYGPLFKTSLLGRPVIFSTNPEFSHYIFQQDGISVEIWYLDSFMKLRVRLIDWGKLWEIHSPGNSKSGCLICQDSPDFPQKSMSFGLASKKLLSYDPSKYPVNLKDAFSSFIKALFCFPLNIPGTVFHKLLKDQRVGLRIIRDIVQKRLDSGKYHGDFVDVIIEEMKKSEPLFNVESASYFLFTILFGSFETVSLALTLAINFLTDHPLVLEELVVINETLRLSNVVPLTSKRAIRDIHKDGYTIPAGWTIMVCPPAIHLNPEKYEDSLAFNPWRWPGQGSNTASKNYMAFGGGMRLCAGAEFAKLQISVVLHFLVTRYRWTKIKGGEILKTPGISFPNGLHIKLTEKQTKSC